MATFIHYEIIISRQEANVWACIHSNSLFRGTNALFEYFHGIFYYFSDQYFSKQAVSVVFNCNVKSC